MAGEGRLEVWARGRSRDGSRVSRGCGRWIMGENDPLSPHRRGWARDHDGETITDASKLGWDTDGVRDVPGAIQG